MGLLCLCYFELIANALFHTLPSSNTSFGIANALLPFMCSSMGQRQGFLVLSGAFSSSSLGVNPKKRKGWRLVLERQEDKLDDAHVLFHVKFVFRGDVSPSVLTSLECSVSYESSQ